MSAITRIWPALRVDADSGDCRSYRLLVSAWKPKLARRTLSATAICLHCGEENPERARFCLACGTPLAAGRAPEEESKVVSILFVDLVGFTASSDQVDPGDVRARLRPYHARLKQEVERFGGTVEKFVGDAVMAAFGAPVGRSRCGWPSTRARRS